MRNYTTWLVAIALGASVAPAWSSDDTTSTHASGLREIPDSELGAMRGRYIVGDNRVAWFGVTMVSNWVTSAGQSIQSAVKLGFDLRGAKPEVSFQPSVTITEQTPALAATAGTGEVDASGLADVGGLVQSVQVAGDGNIARNGMSLQVRDGEVPVAAANTSSTTVADMTLNGAHARASLEDGGVRILLQVAGQGAAEQWIDAGSIGQSIQLAGNGQAVGNQLQLDLVRQSVPSSQTIHQNLIQAIGMTRAGGI
ncbi:hypothetical protein LU699_08935 [Luteimonas fraxinea]|uniref:Uncharacterized protein n=1 Tax=Luteimonas fraxinea TaxID=2901869 RepID=A0ABS8UDJ0_9GAMM|nr:hypothetical protein [Luteimonas fraxinea]MCD9097557.1 hypothetical protein [Luteimonas fraxinea]UHH11803.1 hypothetical protein LU699_08935 [Luteimonas fraxinea]